VSTIDRPSSLDSSQRVTWVNHPMLGAHRIRRQIGSGAMASLFEATHEQLNKTVALEVLHPHVAEDPKAVARLRSVAGTVTGVQLRGTGPMLALSGWF